jgi:hypothetical protein
MAAQPKRHGITLPTTKIQDREFFWVLVDANVDVETDFDTIGSNFQKLVTGLQQVAEMQVIGKPNGQLTVFALSLNTTPEAGPFDYNRIDALETAIEESTGWNVSVYDAELSGGGFNSDY